MGRTRGGLARALLGAIILLAAVSGCEALGPWLPPLAREEAVAPAMPDPVLVRLAAAYAAEPLAQDLARTYEDASGPVSIEVLHGETRRCEELLYAGEADLAFVLRLPGVGEAPVAPVRETVVALDGLMVIVHPSRALHSISTGELTRLYAGTLADWALLGEAPETTLPLSLPARAFARDLLTARVLRGGALTTAALLVPHDRAMVEYVAVHPQAIGYASRAVVDERVKAVALDGLLPSPDNLSRGAYPLTYEIALLSRDDASPEANRVAAYVRGRRGQALVAERYALPR